MVEVVGGKRIDGGYGGCEKGGRKVGGINN